MYIWVTVLLVVVVVLLVVVVCKRAPRLVSAPYFRVFEHPYFFSPTECDHLIQLAKRGNLVDSRLASSVFGNVDQSVRQSSQIWIRQADDPVASAFSYRVARLTGTDPEKQERMQIVKYTPGGHFKPHHDALVNGIRAFGLTQRYITALLYLNTPLEGGSTTFPRIHHTVHAQQGKLLLWQGIDPVSEDILLESEHQGDPLVRGEKWIATIWILL